MPLQNITQKALLTNSEGRILAIRRTESAPSHSLCWDVPGGAIEFGEDPKTAILREIQEEAGLQLDTVDIFAVHSFCDGQTQWITLGWMGGVDSQDVILSYEHDQYLWVTPEEFLELPSWETIYALVKKKFSL